MATGPVMPTDPIELLTPDPNRPAPFLYYYWGGAATSTVLTASYLFTNYTMKRPVFSRIHVTAMFAVGGWFLGQYLDNLRKDYFSEKDAVLRHYVQLHPEDFPIPERKKFSEVLLPWNPIR